MSTRSLLVAVLLVACGGRSVDGSGAGDRGGTNGTGATGGNTELGGTSTGGGAELSGTSTTGGTAGATSGTSGVHGGDGGSGGSGIGAEHGGGSGALPQGAVGGDSNNAGTGGSGGTVGSAGSDTGEGNAYPCLRATRWSTNAVQCASGFIHRGHAGTCPLPASDTIDLGSAGEGPGGAPSAAQCGADTDCGAGHYCVNGTTPSCDSPATTCIKACEVDSDCDSHALCLCQTYVKATGYAVTLGVCVPASCRSDEECGGDFLCAANTVAALGSDGRVQDTCNHPRLFACQSRADTCGSLEGCGSFAECLYDGSAYSCTR